MKDKNKMVIAIDNKEYLKKQCKRIDKQYWLIGDVTKEDSGHCYKINDTYYKGNTGYIVYNHSLNQYVIKKDYPNLIRTVIGFDNEIPIQGYMNVEYNDKCTLYYKNNFYKVANEKLLENSLIYKESLQDGIYYDRRTLDSILFIEPANCDYEFKNSLPYDSKGITGKFAKKYDELYNPEINDSIKKYGNFIKDYTFGVEFETVKGFVPTRITDKLGLIALRDGSINGLEYVTIPLSEKKGLQALVDSIDQLSKRTTYDQDCALHIHIGNIPRTEEFLLALFKTLIAIEDEFYSMFPIYMKYNLGVKKKHYTKKFPMASTLMLMDPIINSSNIKKNFGILYKFLSSGQDYKHFGDLDNVYGHPSDPEGTSKWSIKSRYYWINLIPLLFGNKQTIEFRLHTATLDETKIMNYLAICVSIIDYVKRNTNVILAKPQLIQSLNLKDILFNSFNNHDNNSMHLIETLYSYIDSRKNYIKQCTRDNNILAKEDEFRYRKTIDWSNTKVSNNPIRKVKSNYSQKLLDALDGLNMNIGTFNYVPTEPLPTIIDSDMSFLDDTENNNW